MAALLLDLLLALRAACFAALLDIDGSALVDPESTLATLVMFSSPSCEQCRSLRPHIVSALPT